MMHNHNIWEWGAEFCPCQSNASEDYKWFVITAKLAGMTRSKVKRIKCFDYPHKAVETEQSWENLGFIEDEESSNGENASSCSSNAFPSVEAPPWNTIIGGYMFICCNETMKKDIEMCLFCLPLSYCDSVRAITPGMPLFLFNGTTRQLHGIFEATSFGGYNIDSTAWEDINCKGKSKLPAQVRIRIRKLYKPLEEVAFRPILQNNCDPTVSFELSVVETLALLDLYEKQYMEPLFSH